MPRERLTSTPQPVPADAIAAVVEEATSRLGEMEDKLTAILTRILERAGRTAAVSFRRHVTDHLTAAALREADRAALQRLRMGNLGDGLFGYRLRPEMMTAAAPSPTAAMLCVKPRPDEAEAIADPDGEPPDDLHVTLVYLGDVEDGDVQALVDAVRPVAASHAPLTGTVGGYGRFEPAGVGILLPDVPGLVELRVAVTEALVDADLDYARNHGFEAHITIDADPEADEADLMLTRSGQPLHFDALLLVRGDATVAELPLVGRPPLTAAGPPDTTPLEKRVDRAQQALRDALGTGNENTIRDAKAEVRAAQDALYKAVALPQWTAPGVDEVLNVDALVKALRTKTNPVREQLIKTVMAPTLGEPGMTLEDAIAYYHSPKAFELNAALREGRALTREQKAVVNTLDAAMERSTSAMTLYRGIPNYPDIFGAGGRAALTGRVWDTPGYLSTSGQRDVADQFAGGIAAPEDKPLVMQISVPKGTPMLRVPAGEYGDQDEWLLPREVKVAMGDTSTYSDPFGTDTVKVHSSAVSEGVLSQSTAGVATGSGLGFDVTNPLVAKALAETGKHITSIGDTTRANVMKVIDASWQQGLSIPNTAKAIQAAMADAAPIRARMIARTELVGAINGGSLAATQLVSGATGTPYLKRWQTAPGAPNPRHELYEGLDGQTVGLDEAFDVGGDALQYPGDPDGAPEEVINCRCTMTYVDGSPSAADVRQSIDAPTMWGEEGDPRLADL